MQSKTSRRYSMEKKAASSVPPEMVVSSHMNGTHQSKGKKALVVEDNADSATAVSQFLSTLGYAVEIARNGTEALTVAASLVPDVVFIDIGLPGLDGWQV